jgi:hypothetical protein
MEMVVISTLIPCYISFTHRQVQRFHLLPTVYICTRERCQLQSKNTHVCALSYDPYTKHYIREFLRNVLFPWNTDGRPDLSSRIELGFLPDSFLGLYSDGRNHTRVSVVSYAHGRILSVPSRSVIILRVRVVLPGHSMIILK